MNDNELTMDDQDVLLDTLEMDQETFDALDLNDPQMLLGLIQDHFGEDMIQRNPED